MRSLDPQALQAEHADLGVEAGGPVSQDEEGHLRVPASALRTLLERLRRSAAAAEEERTAQASGAETGSATEPDPGPAGLSLFDLTAIDHGPESPERFEVVYRFATGSGGPGLSLRTTLALAAPDARPEIASIAALFPAAGWLEREVAELFGVAFAGHPDPRPLLLEPGFPGWPLRKDFDDAAVAARGDFPPSLAESEADAS